MKKKPQARLLYHGSLGYRYYQRYPIIIGFEMELKTKITCTR